MPHKRLSLREILHCARAEQAKGGPGAIVVAQFMKDVSTIAAESVGLRYSALTTQARHDHHLKVYRRVCAFTKHLPVDATNDEIDLVAFPDNVDALCDLLRKFVVAVYFVAKPRSSDGNVNVSYNTLCKYRDSMAFWVQRVFEVERKQEAPKRPRISNALTEAMQTIYNKGSTRENHGESHDELKRIDGWYNDDFEGQISEAKRLENAGTLKRRLDETGLMDYDPEVIEPIPHPSRPGLNLGAPDGPTPIPKRFAGVLEECEISAIPPSPEVLPPGLVYGTPGEALRQIREEIGEHMEEMGLRWAPVPTRKNRHQRPDYTK